MQVQPWLNPGLEQKNWFLIPLVLLSLLQWISRGFPHDVSKAAAVLLQGRLISISPAVGKDSELHEVRVKLHLSTTILFWLLHLPTHEVQQ